jgi:SAM-dependent methyltransferase
LVRNSHHDNCQQGEVFSPAYDGPLSVAADQHDRMPKPERCHAGQINYSVDLLRRDEAERNHITEELSLIKEEFGINGCTLLEVGCGLGQNLEIFRASNNVLGIEGLPSAVSEACSRGLAVIKGDLQSPLALASDSIDWLLCLDVLEHLEQPLCLMLEMRRVLRVRGRAVLNVPNHFDLSGRLKLLMGHNLDVHKFFPESDDWDNPHLRFFTHDGIKRMVAASGFQLVQDRSGHFCAFPKRRLFQAAGLNPVLRYLAEKKPSLFAGGFFLIIEKPLAAVDSER